MFWTISRQFGSSKISYFINDNQKYEKTYICKIKNALNLNILLKFFRAFLLTSSTYVSNFIIFRHSVAEIRGGGGGAESAPPPPLEIIKKNPAWLGLTYMYMYQPCGAHTTHTHTYILCVCVCVCVYVCALTRKPKLNGEFTHNQKWSKIWDICVRRACKLYEWGLPAAHCYCH